MAVRCWFVPAYILVWLATSPNSFLNVRACTRQRGVTTRAEGNVIQRMVGSDINVNEYVGSGIGQVTSGDELYCTFDGECCWRNENAGELQWMHASGLTEQAKIRRSFTTDEAPNGDFLVVASEGALSKSEKAQFISCTITCSLSDITLRSRHWQSKGVALMACSVDANTQALITCHPWTAANGVPDAVTLPKGQNVQLVIEANGFTNPAGAVALLDDISVDFIPCGEATSELPRSVSVTPPASLPAACSKIVCNFEQNNPCSYTDARSAGVGTGNANVPWEVSTAPFHNRLTGITKQAEGDHFAAAFLKPGDKATLITEVNYPTDYVVRLNGYRATEGINLFGCCDDVVVCPYSTTEQVQVSDYRTWKTASITCPSGTKKIIFYAVNNGKSMGAVGLDNVQLLVPSDASPDSASQSAC